MAFDVEDEAVLERIIRVQRQLESAKARLKLVEPKNVHVTMRFLGEISPSTVDLIRKAMDEMKFYEFKIRLKGLGAFPKPTFPRAIWIGVREGNDELTRIYSEMESKLRGIGIRPENRPFHPHVTIARLKGGEKSKIVEVIDAMSDYEFGVIVGRSFRLKKSILSPKGPVYSTVHEVTASER